MMKTILTLLAGALIAAPVLAITLSDAEQTQCQAEGGCIVITATRLQSELAALRARTLRECKGAS